MLDLLEDVNTRYGGQKMCDVFRDHIQPGALGQALDTWVRYDEVTTLLTSSSFWAPQTGVLLADSLFQRRGPRQPEQTSIFSTQSYHQAHRAYTPEPSSGGADIPPTTVSLNLVFLAVIG